MKSLNNYIYEALVKQHATKDTVVIYSMELKRIPKTRKAFIEVLKKFANHINFTEINEDDWYKHRQPKDKTFMADDRRIDFYYSNGRVIRITSYLASRRETNTIKIKAYSISKSGYPTGDDYDINVLDGAEWNFINKNKNKYITGDSFNPAELEQVQVKQIIYALFDILNTKNVDRIFKKYFKLKDGDYNRSTRTRCIQYSDICEVEGKIYKYTMKFEDFLKKSIHNTEWMEFRKDGFDTKNFLNLFINGISEKDMYKVYDSIKQKTANIELYKIDKKYNRIDLYVLIDEYRFFESYYESTNPDAYKLFDEFIKNYKQ